MRLTIDALQELYDALVNSAATMFSMSPYVDSPIDRAFRECDEKLSESAAFAHIKDLENRCENLKRSNKALRYDNDKLGDKVIGLNKKNEQLEKELDAKNKENADLSDRLAKLQKHHDYIDRCWTSQIQENMELKKQLGDTRKDVDGWRRRAQEAEKRVGELLLKKYDQAFEDLKKDLDDAKSSANYFRASRDNWRSRAKHEEEEKNEQVNKALGEKFQLQREVEQLKKDLDALLSRTHCAEDEVEQLKKDRDIWVRNNGKKQAEIAELKNRLDKANSDRTALQENLDYYMDIYKKVQDDYDELHKKYSECEATVDKQAEQIRHLKAKQDSVRKNCYDQGQTDLWDMLQNVKDMQPNEFDTDCECLGDVIDMDLEDFLDSYKKWWEQNEIDRMRDWLSDFCRGRVCAGCPLESKEYKCCCGLSFIKVDLSDDRIIPDKDIKRYYEKARGCGRYTLKDAKLFATTVEGVNRAITKACEGFCEAVKDADIKITENLRKGCTLEAKVEVNKDLLATVCGVKPNEEEHKLDYGDAVRVPWRDYDYMYIGPEGNHIRLFNPKTHSVVIVPATENLPYQGCKIILCDEDDIRKIWKDKK